MQFARHLFEYLAARTLVAILALLPPPFATRIAMGGSRLLFACLPRLRFSSRASVKIFATSAREKSVSLRK